MTVSLRYKGRLPGVVCEAALPRAEEGLPQLDVVGFVGFAERGPLNTPVALEDISQYQAVFGGDLLLARQHGKPVFAHLPRAVQAFFDNGGRRCYAVRVAGDAAWANRFRVPGLVAFDGGMEQGRLSLVDAAWVGRWSDAVSVGTQLRGLPLRVRGYRCASDPHASVVAVTLDLEVPIDTLIAVGDVVRVRFGDVGRSEVFLFVDQVAPTMQNGRAVPPVNTTRGRPLTVQATRVRAFATAGALSQVVEVERLGAVGWESVLSPGHAALPGDAWFEAADGVGRLDVPLGSAVRCGDVLRLTGADGVMLWVTATTLAVYQPVDLPFAEPLLRVQGVALWQVVQVERLGGTGWELVLLEDGSALPGALWLEREAGGYHLDLPLGAMVGHGDMLRLTSADGAIRWFSVMALEVHQDDGSPPAAPQVRVRGAEVLRECAITSVVGDVRQAELLSFDLYVREGDQMSEVWRGLRFGGAAPWTGVLTQMPIDAPPLGQVSIGGLSPDQSARLRAPLGGGAAEWYLPLGMSELPLAEGFARALPQQVMVGEVLPGKDGLDSFDAEALFLDDDLGGLGVGSLVMEAERRLYLGVTPQPLRRLHALLPIDEVAVIAVPDAIHRGWGNPADEQEPAPPPEPPPAPPPPIDWSLFRDCSRPAPLPVPPPPRVCVQPFEYRLPSSAPDVPDVRQQLAGMPVLDPPAAYQAAGLLHVQAALVRLCAARADVLAVLSLPEHYDKRAALDWQRALPVVAPDVLAGSVLSFAAVYHPWVLVRETVAPELLPLRALPPDGVVCGMIAARERVRGAWVAPANVPLRGVVGLSMPISVAEWGELFDTQINVIRQQPGQFTLLSAHTLGTDRLLMQISVRRLLMFLRKVALRRGARYVFEPNGPRLRQQVQLAFERLLGQLAARGALAAYQVVTSAEVNTPNDAAHGRFLVALKVAPTLPISFITITLLRSGEGLLELIER